MASHFPSIQSFYSTEVPLEEADKSSDPTKTGDGFTSSEVEAVMNPLSRPFRPSRNYDVCSIAELQTGPHNYEITGRIKLHCSPNEYQPLLGQRVTIWTTSISADNQAKTGHISYCSIATTIYPGRDGTTHITFHVDEPGSEEDRSLRCPLDLNIEQYEYLPGLMTLKSFLTSGYDLGQAKILVCVRNVGPRQTIFPKNREGTLGLVEVVVYDDTASCILKLWEDKIPSANLWVPNQTVLLISQPWCLVNDRIDHQAKIGITINSIVNVDPEFPEAAWLRTKMQDMAKKENSIILFPADTWDLQLAIHGPGRTLYTLAEVEHQVRNQDPASDFTGKLSVIILEMNLMDHWRKITTFCTECCGKPLYANKPMATCKNCYLQRQLSPNPLILGSFLDESGMITGNGLVWNNQAWTQFLFAATNKVSSTGGDQVNAIEQSWQDIATFDTDLLRDLEGQLLYSRATLTFGWSVELSRLCILGVEW
ncbi:hypothetical protein HD806DRAFT_552338 [Xylariaceae sp. AK1471]|nr:hypothetical protein HD806DRAFT_552338 [Xylariaceae sp. AK1471]